MEESPCKQIDLLVNNCNKTILNEPSLINLNCDSCGSGEVHKMGNQPKDKIVGEGTANSSRGSEELQMLQETESAMQVEQGRIFVEGSKRQSLKN